MERVFKNLDENGIKTEELMLSKFYIEAVYTTENDLVLFT